ncbi:von Willebrand factor type A domain protein [compost metagenome]
MRRLPIYFLIDVSESMVGEPIQQVEEGIATIIQALKSDPVAIETVFVSIIIFAGQARTLVPLQEIISFYPPRFPVGSGTSLSRGLGHLMFELRKNIITTTAQQKGDWKPIIFLFTDGVPTDDTTAAINEWKQNWARSTHMVAVSFGEETDTHLLQQLTENVLHFKNTNTAAYKEFFKWVTASIKTSSESVEQNTSGFELSSWNGDTIKKLDQEAPSNYKLDNNFVILAGKCQNTHRPYLMKYRKSLSSNEWGGLQLDTLSYRLVGAYQVDQAYYELSDNEAQSGKSINSQELIGAPTCPSCGNQYAFAACHCGGIHCIGDEEISTCPWCNSQGRYGFGGEGGFNVNRTQG